MTAFNRQLSAAQRQYDNASPDESGHARDEWIDDRSDELFGQYAADESQVLEAVEGVNTLGFDGLLDRRLCDFLLAWRAAPDDAAPLAEAGRYLFDAIWPHVEEQLRADAHLEAEHERNQWEREQSEMRDFYRGKAA